MPQGIDDDEISCQIPTEACPSSGIDVQAFKRIIHLAKIYSQISKNLMSVKAFRQAPSDLLATAARLDKELRAWRESLPPDIRPSDRLKSFQIPRHAKFFSTIFFHYAYYGSLIALNAIFAYPWVANGIFGSDGRAITSDQIIASSNTVANAARNIILVARSLEIDGASLQW